MSAGNVISLVIFLWMVAIYGILCFFRNAHPYRENSEEQKAEDREQARALRRWVNRRRR